MRWENRATHRYYEAVLQRDLFGDWEVWRCWGGIGSARGGCQTRAANDHGAGVLALASIAARRERRGYARREPASQRP